MQTPRMPSTTIEWAIWLWATGGVVAILMQAVWRLTPRALTVFDGTLGAGYLLVAALWVAFMAYAESYRGFHRMFNPRVIVRAAGVAERPTPLHVALAPLVAMGLVHGTPRRLLVSRMLVAGIVVLILLVRWLPEPWRAIVDLGVVVGLLLGMLSLVTMAGRAALGSPPSVDPEFPEPA
ncbi:MAG: hypothetical protein AAF211_32345 [Myxococcota bacterium]